MSLNRVFVLCAALLMAACGERGSRQMADGKEWTRRNSDVDVAGSYCYGDVAADCQRYGRLYTWESARRACASLGSGWRLPTDDEWQGLAHGYGGDGPAAYRALLFGGSSGFDAVLGGGRDVDGRYARLEAHGFYWTASESGPGSAIYYNFGRGGLALHRQDGGGIQRAFSVRCVRD